MCWPGDVCGPPKGRWPAGCCLNGPGAQEKSGLETDLMVNMSEEGCHLGGCSLRKGPCLRGKGQEFCCLIKSDSHC